MNYLFIFYQIFYKIIYSFFIKFFRIFEVRGTHLDYKPPEVKTSSVLKATKATLTRNKVSDDIKSETMKRKIREIHDKDRDRGKLMFFIC